MEIETQPNLEPNLELNPQNVPELERYLYINKYSNKKVAIGGYVLLSPEEVVKWGKKSVHKLKEFMKKHGQFIERPMNVKISDFENYLLLSCLFSMQNALLENIRQEIGTTNYKQLPDDMREKIANPPGLKVIYTKTLDELIIDEETQETQETPEPQETPESYQKILKDTCEAQKPEWYAPDNKFDRSVMIILEKMCNSKLHLLKNK